MNTTKSWYQSKTIWGILAAAAGTFLISKGIDVPAPAANADFTALNNYAAQVKAANGNITQIAGVVVSAFGTIYAIYGRIKADTAIATTSTAAAAQ